MFQKIDPAKEVFQLNRILSDVEKSERVRLESALEYIASVMDADRAYLSYWNHTNQSIATIAQWNSPLLEPMPEKIFYLKDPSLLDAYLEQNVGMFRMFVEPVFCEHRLSGYLCLESSFVVNSSVESEEQNFIQYASHLIAPFTQGSHLEKLTKEIDIDDLVGSQTEVRNDPNRPIVLIVEDNKINQFTMSEFWKRVGTRIQLANNGAEAVQLCSDQKYDLILMDLNMPVMDGYDATREIVTYSEKNKDTPIVAVTAVTDRGTDGRCKKLGMVDYVAKPIRLQRIEELAEKYLPALS